MRLLISAVPLNKADFGNRPENVEMRTIKHALHDHFYLLRGPSLGDSQNHALEDTSTTNTNKSRIKLAISIWVTIMYVSVGGYNVGV